MADRRMRPQLSSFICVVIFRWPLSFHCKWLPYLFELPATRDRSPNLNVNVNLNLNLKPTSTFRIS
jgi:hypothetical protein